MLFGATVATRYIRAVISLNQIVGRGTKTLSAHFLRRRT